MQELLIGLMTEIPDDDALAALAASFNARADGLSEAGSGEAFAWCNVYRLLALAVEVAVLRRRTGVAV